MRATRERAERVELTAKAKMKQRELGLEGETERLTAKERNGGRFRLGWGLKEKTENGQQKEKKGSRGRWRES